MIWIREPSLILNPKWKQTHVRVTFNWSQGGNCMPWLEALHNVHCLDSGHIHNINCMYIFFFYCSTFLSLCSGWSTYHSCTMGSGLCWKCSTLENNCMSVGAEEDAGLCRAPLHSTLWTWMVAWKRSGFYWQWRLVTGFLLTFASGEELMYAIFEGGIWGLFLQVLPKKTARNDDW